MGSRNMRTGYGHMVHGYFTDKVKAKRDARKEIFSSLSSREDALKYQRKARRAIKKAFGPFPGKTDLNPEITGVIRRACYKIEKLTFESRPGIVVTANLYVPLNGVKKHPGVVMPCGHSIIGKAEPRYQEACQRLVRSGFMVLVYDPFSQGERNQYLNYKGPQSEDLASRCVFAHNMTGKQLELIGEFFGSWRAWDGIRALDYLLSRPEVDGKRIGVTGNSGGGTLTTWLWALEARFTMAAPSCFITTFLANLENELPADCEQCPPGVIGNGLEMADFLIARAPEPLIILGQKYDFFDCRGLEESYSEVKRFYKILGAENNVRRFIGSNAHGYHPDAQEKMLSFFCRHGGIKKKKTENITVSKPQTLAAVPGGEVLKNGAIPVYAIIKEKAEALGNNRKPPGESELAERVKDVLKLPGVDYVPRCRILRPAEINGMFCARFAVETEDNIETIIKKALPEGGQPFVLEPGSEAKVYIPHLSSEADLAEGEIPGLWMNNLPFYCLDVRGMGESMPDESGDFLQPYGMDYMFHAYSVMLGESYFGRRVHDCVSALRLLSSRGARRIHLFGRGQGAVIALFAALFHPRVKSLVLKNGPSSFGDWAKNPASLWPAANFPRGVLEYFDIEDCVKAVKCEVRAKEPRGPFMRR